MNVNKKIKKIAVMTSGGDAPGMNAAIRAVVRTALANDIEVYGIKSGFKGLTNGEFYTEKNSQVEQLVRAYPFLKEKLSETMSSASVSQIIGRGGTLLKTSRYPEFEHQEVRVQAIKVLRDHQIQGLIVIGGNGSYQGARLIAQEAPDIQVIGVPATIDNDLAWTDYTIGYDSATNALAKMFDRIRDTADSHSRVFVVGAMGRDVGDLALSAGISSGAEIVMMPEFPIKDSELQTMLQEKLRDGRTYATIVVAEGVMKPEALVKKLTAMGYEARSSDLGHAQRGGAPTIRDRNVASFMGSCAVQYLLDGKSGVAVSSKGEDFIPVSFEQIFTQIDEEKRGAKANQYEAYQKITYGKVMVPAKYADN